MKSLTVEEAMQGLDRFVDLALEGERIQIRKGNGIVELRPASSTGSTAAEPLAPREALRLLQEKARLTQPQADDYLRALREERLESERREPA